MRWKCKVAYDGTAFEGWQSQPNGNTVQDFIEKRLSYLFDEPIRIHASGRTDRGVHARGQVFHFDGDWTHGGETLIKALRTGYPNTIQVYEAEPINNDFHARYSATGKRYIYQLYEGYAPPFDIRFYWSLGERRLDLEKVNEVAKVLLGKHDFTSFSANGGAENDSDPIKDLRMLDAKRDGSRVIITTEASGYAYKMVRSLVGCLVDVGVGKLDKSEVQAILEAKERTNQVLTAPAQGLFLDEVFYG